MSPCNDLCPRGSVLVGKQAIDHSVARAHIALLIEEFDREPRHLQAELRGIEACFASDICQLDPLAGVLRNGLANLL